MLANDYEMFQILPKFRAHTKVRVFLFSFWGRNSIPEPKFGQNPGNPKFTRQHYYDITCPKNIHFLRAWRRLKAVWKSFQTAPSSSKMDIFRAIYVVIMLTREFGISRILPQFRFRDRISTPKRKNKNPHFSKQSVMSLSLIAFRAWEPKNKFPHIFFSGNLWRNNVGEWNWKFPDFAQISVPGKMRPPK